ncbi:hypothetical protein LF1_46820 [Rubripirellula obstinata]|uniref:Uncharacterized protein n=1 Tax=Rubripirellula obstinata TaxID=406547 RepID=A0A5B1CPE2_9BACT|nr:hypothetical protein [Rubripirellula obstinata]KAA1262121.1 hypothetical protein LF1_46820 [Rubripirellula obstinata]
MTRSPNEIFLESFLDVRAKLLEVAATLDRIERAGDELSSDAADLRGKIDQAIAICASSGTDRAERLQHLFSREFDPDWRKEMNL